jgi:hypothetical protein
MGLLELMFAHQTQLRLVAIESKTREQRSQLYQALNN